MQSTRRRNRLFAQPGCTAGARYCGLRPHQTPTVAVEILKTAMSTHYGWRGRDNPYVAAIRALYFRHAVSDRIVCSQIHKAHLSGTELLP